MARALRRAPAHQGRPHGRCDDAAGRALGQLPSTPDGESTPTLDLPAAGLAHRLENQRLRERPLTAATHEPPCHDSPYDPMSTPTVAGTVRRPSADLHRPRAREALSAHPPAPVDLATSGSLQQPAENTSAPATLAPSSLQRRERAVSGTAPLLEVLLARPLVAENPRPSSVPAQANRWSRSPSSRAGPTPQRPDCQWTTPLRS